VSITIDGITAEKLAREWLIKKKIFNLQQLDWICKYNNKYFIVEVKSRELYKPPPFLGTGLDIRQLKLRNQLFIDLKIDTLLLIFEKDTNNIYYEFLSKLEKTKYFDTKNKIRIYNIINFRKD
jgi:hypothetical protein